MRRPQEATSGQLRADTEGDAEKLVSQARIVHALCMMRKHDWPEWNLDPRVNTLPTGYTVGPIRSDGLLDITEHCLRKCGETMTYLVRSDELFGIGIRRNYHRPKDRPVIARGISREVWAMPLQAALQDRVLAAARRATEAADRGVAAAEARGGEA
jgi:hypothetical protein